MTTPISPVPADPTTPSSEEGLLSPKEEASYHKERIFRGLGVGPFPQAGGVSPGLLKLLGVPPDWLLTKHEYLKGKLPEEMAGLKGKKRLRKKRAKRWLLQEWGFLQPARLVAGRKLDYVSLGKKLLLVEPLPHRDLPVYDKDLSIAEVVCGKEEEEE
jgi:hypothetical protein